MIEKFIGIFEGQTRGYGETISTDEIREDGKRETKNAIRRSPVTTKHWENHLNGIGNRFGCIPITDDNTCKWGCIDIDVYDLNHVEIIKKIKELKLPLIYFRSKSNGAHIFLFVKEPVAAKDMIKKLKAMAALIGHSGREIFPKQDIVLIEKGDLGSYLNVPYYNYKKPDQCMLDETGKELPIEEFFKAYDEIALTKNQFSKLGFNKGKQTDDRLKGMPPCLVTLLQMKLGPGMRNDTFYNLAIYCKKRYGDQWADKLAEYNCDDFMEEKLTLNEINSIIGSVNKKEYQYTCKREPLYGHCQADICIKREYGVGDEMPMPQITQVRKQDSDPPIFFIDIDGKTVVVPTAKEALNFESFQALAFEQINDPLDTVPKKMWIKLIRKKIFEDPDGLVIPAAVELLKEYKLKESMRDFIKSRQGDTPESVSKGKTYTEEGKTYFKLRSFYTYYNTSRNEKTKYHLFANDVQKILKSDANSQLTVKLKDGSTKRTTYWSIPEMDLDEIKLDRKEKKKAAFEE